jgi:hypothetical protein
MSARNSAKSANHKPASPPIRVIASVSSRATSEAGVVAKYALATTNGTHVEHTRLIVK